MLIPRFSIVGGIIKVQKSVFVKEMLCRDSGIKALLNWKDSDGFTFRHPAVSQIAEDDTVTIDFGKSDSIDIGESPEVILGNLKSKYRDKIRGKVACRGSVYTFEIDLNSDDGKINYVME